MGDLESNVREKLGAQMLQHGFAAAKGARKMRERCAQEKVMPRWSQSTLAVKRSLSFHSKMTRALLVLGTACLQKHQMKSSTCNFWRRCTAFNHGPQLQLLTWSWFLSKLKIYGELKN